MVTYAFRGQAAHAAAAPSQGRSALDACELMNVGVNYLREHVPPGCRFHYAYRSAPSVPNVVPEYASLLYHIRGQNTDLVTALRSRIDKIAKGAALMTETCMESEEILSVPETIPSLTLTAAADRLLSELKMEPFSQEDRVFASKLLENAGRLPVSSALDEGIRRFHGTVEQRMGSSDVASVSHLIPTVMLRNTCVPVGIPQHHWAFAASCGSALGRRGARNAVRSLSALLLYLALDQSTLTKAGEELRNSIAQRKGEAL